MESVVRLGKDCRAAAAYWAEAEAIAHSSQAQVRHNSVPAIDSPMVGMAVAMDSPVVAVEDSRLAVKLLEGRIVEAERRHLQRRGGRREACPRSRAEGRSVGVWGVGGRKDARSPGGEEGRREEAERKSRSETYWRTLAGCTICLILLSTGWRLLSRLCSRWGR